MAFDPGIAAARLPSQAGAAGVEEKYILRRGKRAGLYGTETEAAGIELDMSVSRIGGHAAAFVIAAVDARRQDAGADKYDQPSVHQNTPGKLLQDEF